jgi:uncharacterized membrane protein YbhN (UPF0104 family)
VFLASSILLARVSRGWWPRRKLEATAAPLRLHGSHLRGTLLISLATQVLGIVAYSLVGIALGIPADWSTFAWIRSAMIMATMVPISVAGFGLREVTSLVLLGTYDVSPTTSVAFALLVFAVTTLSVALVGGLLEFLRILTPVPGDGRVSSDLS